MTHLRTMVSPRTYVANPWIRFGAAFAVGYKLGRPERSKPVPLPATQPDHPESLIYALVRTAFWNLATSAIHDALNQPER